MVGLLVYSAVIDLSSCVVSIRPKFLPDGSPSGKSNLDPVLNRGIFFVKTCSHVF